MIKESLVVIFCTLYNHLHQINDNDKFTVNSFSLKLQPGKLFTAVYTYKYDEMVTSWYIYCD